MGVFLASRRLVSRSVGRSVGWLYMISIEPAGFAARAARENFAILRPKSPNFDKIVGLSWERETEEGLESRPVVLAHSRRGDGFRAAQWSWVFS